MSVPMTGEPFAFKESRQQIDSFLLNRPQETRPSIIISIELIRPHFDGSMLVNNFRRPTYVAGPFRKGDSHLTTPQRGIAAALFSSQGYSRSDSSHPIVAPN